MPLSVPLPGLAAQARVTLIGVVAGNQVVELVEHLHRHRRADRDAGRRAGGLLQEQQVVAAPVVMLKAAEVAPVEAAGAGSECVAGAHLVDRQVAEGGDAAAHRRAWSCRSGCRRSGWCRWPGSRRRPHRRSSKLLKASSTCTVTAGLRTLPATVVVGCWPNAGRLALAGVTLAVAAAR